MSAIDSTPANTRAEGRTVRRALDRLREETSSAHGALDKTLQIVDRLSATDQRVRLVSGYHLLHHETENKVAPFLGGVADLDFSERRRSSLIAEALGNSVKVRSPTARPAPTFVRALRRWGHFTFSRGRAWAAASF